MTETTKDRILIAATSLFSSVQYSKVSFRLIASGAGVSHSYVHRAWPSKTALFRDVMINATKSVPESIRRITDSSSPITTLIVQLASLKSHILCKLLQQCSMDRESWAALAGWEDGMAWLQAFSKKFYSKRVPGCPELDGDALLMILFNSFIGCHVKAPLILLGWDNDRISIASSNVSAALIRLMYISEDRI